MCWFRPWAGVSCNDWQSGSRSKRVKSLHVLLFALFAMAALRADTVVFVNGRELEGKVLQRDENSIRFEVDSGVVVIPMSRVKRVDMDTPQQAEERERKKVAAQEFAARMKEEGKILYKGQWLPEEEVRAQERLVVAKRKAREAEEAAKKAEEAARKAQEAAMRAALTPLPYNNHGFMRSTGRRNRYDNYGYGNDFAYPYSGIYGGGIVIQDGSVRNSRRW